MSLLGKDCVLLFFQRIDLVIQSRRGEAQRSARLADGPQASEAMQRILALLDSELVTQRAGLGLLRSAEAAALIANDGLDRRQQLGRGHQRDRHARAFEHRFDHFAVAVVRNDDAVFDGVAADDAAGGNGHIEDGIGGGRELVHQLARRRPAIEGAGIALFDDHDARALDAFVAGIDRGGDEVGEAHVGDEASALLDVQASALRRLSIRRCAALPLNMPVSTPT